MQTKTICNLLIVFFVISGITLSLITMRSIYVLAGSDIAAMSLSYNVGRIVGCLITSVLAYRALRSAQDISKCKNNPLIELYRQGLILHLLFALSVILFVPITLVSVALLGEQSGPIVFFLFLNTFLLIERRKRVAARMTTTINTILLIVLNSIFLFSLLLTAIVLII